MASGAGSTNWEAYGLEQLWQMVCDEDKAATISMDRHAAFGVMHDVLEHEVDVLTRAVEQLEAKWPPRPGTAAEAFTSFVRSWIASMAETAEGAAATQQVIGDITTELTWARSRVAELMAVNRRLVEVEEADSFVAEVCAQYREALTREARRILAEADFAVATAAERLPEFQWAQRDHDPAVLVGKSDGGEELRSGWIGSTPVPYIEPPVNQPPRPVSKPGVPATPGPEPASAPVLAGSPAPVLTGPGGGLVSSALVGPDGVIRASTGASATPGVAGPGGAAVGSGVAPASPTGSAGVPARAGTASGMMPMPPVIPPAGARASSPGPGVVPGGRSARPGVRRKRKDPSDPWYVPEGVPPVLEPGPPPRFDPGPGVIGIDR